MRASYAAQEKAAASNPFASNSSRSSSGPSSAPISKPTPPPAPKPASNAGSYPSRGTVTAPSRAAPAPSPFSSRSSAPAPASPSPFSGRSSSVQTPAYRPSSASLPAARSSAPASSLPAAYYGKSSSSQPITNRSPSYSATAPSKPNSFGRPAQNTLTASDRAIVSPGTYGSLIDSRAQDYARTLQPATQALVQKSMISSPVQTTAALLSQANLKSAGAAGVTQSLPSQSFSATDTVRGQRGLAPAAPARVSTSNQTATALGQRGITPRTADPGLVARNYAARSPNTPAGANTWGTPDTPQTSWQAALTRVAAPNVDVKNLAESVGVKVANAFDQLSGGMLKPGQTGLVSGFRDRNQQRGAIANQYGAGWDKLTPAQQQSFYRSGINGNTAPGRGIAASENGSLHRLGGAIDLNAGGDRGFDIPQASALTPKQYASIIKSLTTDDKVQQPGVRMTTIPNDYGHYQLVGARQALSPVQAPYSPAGNKGEPFPVALTKTLSQAGTYYDSSGKALPPMDAQRKADAQTKLAAAGYATGATPPAKQVAATAPAKPPSFAAQLASRYNVSAAPDWERNPPSVASPIKAQSVSYNTPATLPSIGKAIAQVGAGLSPKAAASTYRPTAADYQAYRPGTVPVGNPNLTGGAVRDNGGTPSAPGQTTVAGRPTMPARAFPAAAARPVSYPRPAGPALPQRAQTMVAGRPDVPVSSNYPYGVANIPSPQEVTRPAAPVASGTGAWDAAGAYQPAPATYSPTAQPPVAVPTPSGTESWDAAAGYQLPTSAAYGPTTDTPVAASTPAGTGAWDAAANYQPPATTNYGQQLPQLTPYYGTTPTTAPAAPAAPSLSSYYGMAPTTAPADLYGPGSMPYVSPYGAYDPYGPDPFAPVGDPNAPEQIASNYMPPALPMPPAPTQAEIDQHLKENPDTPNEIGQALRKYFPPGPTVKYLNDTAKMAQDYVGPMYTAAYNGGTDPFASNQNRGGQTQVASDGRPAGMSDAEWEELLRKRKAGAATADAPKAKFEIPGIQYVAGGAPAPTFKVTKLAGSSYGRGDPAPGSSYKASAPSSYGRGVGTGRTIPGIQYVPNGGTPTRPAGMTDTEWAAMQKISAPSKFGPFGLTKFSPVTV